MLDAHDSCCGARAQANTALAVARDCGFVFKSRAQVQAEETRHNTFRGKITHGCIMILLRVVSMGAYALPLSYEVRKLYPSRCRRNIVSRPPTPLWQTYCITPAFGCDWIFFYLRNQINVTTETSISPSAGLWRRDSSLAGHHDVVNWYIFLLTWSSFCLLGCFSLYA